MAAQLLVGAVRRRVIPLLSIFLAVGCDAANTAEPVPPSKAALGDPVRGLAAFELECAACHSARDGFDLAFFGFSDTTVVRRAVGHVDSTTAWSIVAHLHTLRTPQATRDLRVFQPQGVVLASDVDFAVGVFGADAWPAAWTSADFARIDPTRVAVALGMPQWSREGDNLDWMPEHPVSAAALARRNGLAETLLDRYYASRSLNDLTMAVQALRIADRDTADAKAPCIFEPIERLRPEECFEQRRWTASLAAQHVLRTGDVRALPTALHDAWWDVGNAARRALQVDQHFEHGSENWASWMYLGWQFAPERHASVYLGSALTRLGLPRHAAFVGIRSQVARPAGGDAPYMDARTVARFAPAHWTYAATKLAFTHLLERQAKGDVPRSAMHVEEARASIEQAIWLAGRKVTATQAAELRGLGEKVLAGL